ncbi:MAG: DUF4062 domain-containing protein [Phycisphaerales bacterium]|nr:DUF4062 domain-containing protein [Phycisphaerales bacterium]
MNWNAAHSLVRKAVLLPVDWESGSAPDLSGRAQAVINEQLGVCDLLVGVFWTRLGTPTGTSPSGTAEEIDRHLERGRPVMLYFCNRDVPRSADREQFDAVFEAERRYRALGVTWAYSTQEELAGTLRHHLDIHMNKLLAKVNSVPAAASATPDALSEIAWQLLEEAAKDRTGLVLVYSSNGSKAVQTHGKLLCDGSNARESARWVAALEALVSARLVTQRDLKGQSFAVTEQGYRAIESR